MAGLLAAEGISPCKHLLQYVSVAHFCGYHLYAVFLGKEAEANVCHNSDHGSIVSQPATLAHVLCENGNELVAVNNSAVLINGKASVRIAVKCNAQITAVCLYKV